MCDDYSNLRIINNKTSDDDHHNDDDDYDHDEDDCADGDALRDGMCIRTCRQ